MNDAQPSIHRKILLYIKKRWLRTQDHINKRWFRYFSWRKYVYELQNHSFSAITARQTGKVYIDVSVICTDDAATGIQRVVRSVAFHLNKSGEMLKFSPIFIHTYKKNHYIVNINEGRFEKTNELVEYFEGDVFFGLDYCLDTIWRMRKQLSLMKKKGVKFWYLVHDFLPYTHPSWFSSPTVLRFYNWLAIIAASANGFFCVSQPVARQLRNIIKSDFGVTNDVAIQVIPLGCDLSHNSPLKGFPDGFDVLLEKVRTTPSLLMVGTIEPRKGHKDALRAMEVLWKAGHPTQLVLVGGKGWKIAEFIAELDAHPENGHRLIRTDKISDEALDLLYQNCTGVLFPSLAEGFGLPVVEALKRGKPVLARRLEVFAEHAGKGVTFFDEEIDAPKLASTISEWLKGLPGDEPARPDLLATWDDTARCIADILRHSRNGLGQMTP
ncbi:glycosyltransferase family 1 protein [Novosphingobium sp. EMRT-2]|uniref:glycosyltransferase family 4 protein n=1 Tax=Novosphingobium sp. EMRT-2 TaxID=2571749 RepID=UPI0010BD7E9A|nr:glycosyltransferase family 1 protein [Novosphingobium sp. EMRT-2]QCI93578.1 glycosyltransferase family 4 protein [Novosphingobium sp. EMRT-2]